MDRRPPATPVRRELTFCHECENRWYRDEHSFGFTCPACHSDFIEIVRLSHSASLTRRLLLQIEPDHDPPDEFESPLQWRHRSPFEPDIVPDPDEGDIRQFGSMPFPPRPGPSMQNTDPHRAQVANNFANTFSGLLGANAGQPPLGGTFTTRTYNLGNGTITFSSGTLHPRNANGPQPGMMPPLDNLHNVLGQMLIGLDGAATRGAFHDPGGAHPPLNPLSALLSALLNPAAAQHGDAVYTQEALDRVISQLMEQNATGNAPGPASVEAMANLPKINVTKDMLGDNGKAECSICMDEVHLGDEVTQLYCKHWFHEQCVKAWLGEHDTCPHCRKGISEISQQQQQQQPPSQHQQPQQGPSTPSSHRRRTSASASRNAPGAFSDNTDNWRRSNSGMRRVSDHRSGRRSSDTGGGGGGGGSGGGGLLDRARSFFGGRS